MPQRREHAGKLPLQVLRLLARRALQRNRRQVWHELVTNILQKILQLRADLLDHRYRSVHAVLAIQGPDEVHSRLQEGHVFRLGGPPRRTHVVSLPQKLVDPLTHLLHCDALHIGHALRPSLRPFQAPESPAPAMNQTGAIPASSVHQAGDYSHCQMTGLLTSDRKYPHSTQGPSVCDPIYPQRLGQQRWI